jgi:hypothetical protein
MKLCISGLPFTPSRPSHNEKWDGRVNNVLQRREGLLLCDMLRKLRVFESKILRRLFGRTAKQQGNDENYITSTFFICISKIK